MSTPRPMASELDLVLVAERASATRASGNARRHVATRRAAPSPAVALSLDSAQRWFQTVVTHPDGVDAGARAAQAGAPEASIAGVIADGAQISAQEALGIYSYGYRARLVECLADDYPTLAHALGHDDFHALASAYIERHPSSSRNLNVFGRHMASFCLERADPRAAFSADLARLEWALVEILHAEDDVSIDAAALAEVPPERFQEALLTASATLRVLRFEYDVNAYFQAFKDELSPSLPEPGPAATAVYRKGFTLWRMNLTPAMTALLEALGSGTRLGEALSCMAATVSDPEALADAERNVSAWFQSWVTCGFFRDISLPSAS